MSKAIKVLGWQLGFGVTLVSACWGIAMMGEASVLMIPAIFGGVFVSLWQYGRQFWIPVTVVVVLNPLAVSFAGGITDYWGGAPSLWFMGLPRISSFNVDPANRCFHRGCGCCIWGNEWVYLDPHNAAVRLMLHFFGPPSKSYNGPYPTKEEAEHLVAKAPTTPVDDFLKGRIHVDDAILPLQPEVVNRLVERLALSFALEESIYDAHDKKIQATLYQDRCLILRIFVALENSRDAECDLMIFFDKKTGRPFAYFNSRRNDSPRFPPVRYLPEQER